jgi:hypothetical protein
MSIEAMKWAIEVFLNRYSTADQVAEVIGALRQAIEQSEKQDMTVSECTCKAADMPFGRCCKEVEQKPVGWMYTINDKVGEVSRMVCLDRYNLEVTSPYGREGIDYAEGMLVKELPVYTAPPKREWVGLTDEDFYGQSELQVMAMKYAEAKLKEKNT